MAKIITHNSCLRCTFGSAESRLQVPEGTVMVEGEVGATEADAVPFVNIQPFGICSATQKPCMPVTSMWVNSSANVEICGKRLITEESRLPCAVGGMISPETSQESVDN